MKTKTQRNNEIKQKKLAGVSMSQLAKEYGVSESRISQIVYSKRSYKKRTPKPLETDAKPNTMTVKVNVPFSDIGAILTVLAERNYEFSVAA
jgi:transcriptional regulator with XRE-family HTH domain